MDPQPLAAGSTHDPHQCVFCPQSFTTRRDLVDHKVKSQDHFYCRRCRLDLPTAVDLQQHLEGPVQAIAFAQHGQVRCNPCRLDFASMSFLTTHLYTNHWNLCKDCLLDFHSGWALNRHRATAHSKSNRPFSVANSTTPTHILPSAPTSSALLTETEQQPSEPRSTEQPVSQSTEHVSQEVSQSAELVLQPTEPVPEEVPPQSHDESQHIPPPEPKTEEAGVQDEAEPVAESSARPRLPPFCASCRVRFPSEEALQQHLEHSSSVIPHCRLPNGSFRCFICLRMFPALAAFKKHLARLDRRHEETLNHYKWCTRCLLQFHTHKGLTKHMNEQHVPHPTPQQEQALSGPNEADSPSTQPAPSHVTTDLSSPNLASSSMSPVDRLFASISLSASTLPSDHETWDSAASDSLLATVVEETQDPVSSITNGSSAPSTTPSATNQSAAVEITEGEAAPSSAVDVITEPSTRSDQFFCRKCRLGFSSSQEQSEHVRNGMSAIKESENGDGSFVCAQCARPFSDIRAIKRHLRSHDLTCMACLMYFHTLWAWRAHKQSHHAPNSNNGDTSIGISPQPLSSATDSTRADHPPIHLVSQDTQSATRESRPGPRDHHRPPRSRRVVRQISIMDFSDTDDDLLSDPDASNLGGWDLSDIQRPRGSNADSYAGRTGLHPNGRNTRPNGRREPDDDQWWWDGPPPAASWDDLAAGRVSRAPQSIKITPSSKSSVHPKLPRVSSVAIACSVCLEEAAVDLTSTPCGHVGCETCLRTAVKTKPECPICRKPTKLSDLRPLFL